MSKRVLADKSADYMDDVYIRSVCFNSDGKPLATGAEVKTIPICDIVRK